MTSVWRGPFSGPTLTRFGGAGGDLVTLWAAIGAVGWRRRMAIVVLGWLQRGRSEVYRDMFAHAIRTGSEHQNSNSQCLRAREAAEDPIPSTPPPRDPAPLALLLSEPASDELCPVLRVSE